MILQIRITAGDEGKAFEILGASMEITDGMTPAELVLCATKALADCAGVLQDPSQRRDNRGDDVVLAQAKEALNWTGLLMDEG